MRWIEVQEKRAPLVRNVIYAAKTIWGADKWYMLASIGYMTIDMVFEYFVQNILFLKILLSIIEGERDFKVYVRYLVIFAVSALVCKGGSWFFTPNFMIFISARPRLLRRAITIFLTIALR